MPVPVRGRRAEHTEGSIGTAEESDASRNHGAEEQNAAPCPEYAHHAPALASRVGEDRTGFIAARASGQRRVKRLVREASVEGVDQRLIQLAAGPAREEEPRHLTGEAPGLLIALHQTAIPADDPFAALAGLVPRPGSPASDVRPCSARRAASFARP